MLRTDQPEQEALHIQPPPTLHHRLRYSDPLQLHRQLLGPGTVLFRQQEPFACHQPKLASNVDQEALNLLQSVPQERHQEPSPHLY